VLGYPIRKPPDQRSVANSPGHIAGSHVLHRLLMPRHPPCALKNLNTKVTRCSRSLCSSQNTNGHQPTTTTNTHPTATRKKILTAERHDAVWRPDRPARPRHPANPARQTRSGLKKTHPPPNPTQQVCGVVRFLRTQQCDRSRRLPEMVFLNPPRTAGSTHIRDNPADDRIASAPLMS
jgi:hypothetical protein